MILGIDPGLSGAVALLDRDGSLVAAYDMPTVDKSVSPAALRALIDSLPAVPREAWIEQVAAMPKQGVSSTFAFGRAFGIAEGVVSAMGIAVRLVRPAVWKSHHRVTSDKETSRALALRLWPSQAEVFARKRDENRAEAALIARYGFDRAPKAARRGSDS